MTDTFDSPNQQLLLDNIFSGQIVEMAPLQTYRFVLATLICFLKHPNPRGLKPDYVNFDHYRDSEAQVEEEDMKKIVDTCLQNNVINQFFPNNGLDSVIKGEYVSSHVFGMGILIPDSASAHITFYSKSIEQRGIYMVQLNQAYYFGEYKIKQIIQVFNYLENIIGT